MQRADVTTGVSHSFLPQYQHDITPRGEIIGNVDVYCLGPADDPIERAAAERLLVNFLPMEPKDARLFFAARLRILQRDR